MIEERRLRRPPSGGASFDGRSFMRHSWIQRTTCAAAVLGAALFVCTSRPASAQVSDCVSVSMTVSAAHSVDPGFEGLWKYTITGTWNVGQHALSHVDFFFALENC